MPLHPILVHARPLITPNRGDVLRKNDERHPPRAPLLESLALYAAKSGDELVKEQSYVFKDRGGSEITLRPELTPSLARMVAQRQDQLTFPLRWWSFGPFWRYERPQKGRTREFFQWNVDMLGAESPEADAENVAVLATFFGRVGLDPSRVVIYVNDRRLMNAQFAPTSPPAGSVAVSSQSGALGLAILQYASELNIGVSHFISVGNKADVSGNDLLEYWEADPATRVILMYMESFGNPARFMQIAQRVARGESAVPDFRPFHAPAQWGLRVLSQLRQCAGPGSGRQFEVHFFLERERVAQVQVKRGRAMVQRQVPLLGQPERRPQHAPTTGTKSEWNFHFPNRQAVFLAVRIVADNLGSLVRPGRESAAIASAASTGTVRTIGHLHVSALGQHQKASIRPQHDRRLYPVCQAGQKSAGAVLFQAQPPFRL